MNRCVGDASSVNSVPIRTVSVENAGWSEGEEVKPSSMHELNAADASSIEAMSANMCRSVFIS